MVEDELGVELDHRWTEGMAEGERRLFFQLLDMGRRANWAEALREQTKKAAAELFQELGAKIPKLKWAKATVVKLHAELDVIRVEQIEEHDDAECVILAKQDLKRALEEAKREANGLQLSSGLGTTKAEATTLRDQVVNLDAEVVLLSKLESSKAEITRLRGVGGSSDGVFAGGRR
ncbi:hypothetical protein ACLOJK_021818 [Asimina triloba]